MTEVAGEVCDGFFFHPFTTDRYLREVTLPALERGRAKAGRPGLDGFTLAGPAFTCVGRDEAELAVAVKGTKDQIAFYASTPAYRAGARPARLGRAAARAHPPVEGGALVRHGRRHRRRAAPRLRRRRAGRPRSARGSGSDGARSRPASRSTPPTRSTPRCGPRSSTPSGPDGWALAPTTRRGRRSCRGRRRRRRSAG